MRKLLAILLILTASEVYAVSMTISWADNSSDEAGFRIERRLQTGIAGIYQTAGTVGPGVTSFVDVGLLPETGYCYRVVAFNSFGEVASAEECDTTSTGNDPVTITTASLPNGIVGVAYSQDLASSGGIGAPFTYTLFSGTLPDGVSLSSAGHFSGTPTAVQLKSFVVQSCDGDSPESCGTRGLSITTEESDLSITTTSFPTGTVGVAYSSTATATGGTLPYTWTKLSGSFPDGLNITGSTGEISGVPTVPGTFNFTVRVTDDDSSTDDLATSITVNATSPALVIDYVVPTSTSVLIRLGAIGMSTAATCSVAIQDFDHDIIATGTSTTGSAKRLVLVTDLTPDTDYFAAFPIDSCNEAVLGFPYLKEFHTLPTPTGGNRTVPLQFGAPAITLSGVARLTVEYDDNEALSSPDSQQNTSCATGCTVNLSLAAGLYYYRWKWQTAADVVLATSAIQPLIVQ